MKSVVFPYGIRFREDGRIDIFPAAELVLTGRGGKGIRALFHIDSGATTSVLPASDAETLGIRLDRGSKMIVRGFTGDAINGYRATIRIRFGSKTLRIPFIFVDGVAPKILGREGVFPRFAVLFDEAQRRTALLDVEKNRSRIDTLFS